jgi:hypothetical protein
LRVCRDARPFVRADLRDTAAILLQAADTLDFTQPVDAVPSGSWLAIAHPASDVVPGIVTIARHLSRRSVVPTTLRTHAGVSRFFDGLELLPSGSCNGPAGARVGREGSRLLRARPQTLIGRPGRQPGPGKTGALLAADLSSFPWDR